MPNGVYILLFQMIDPYALKVKEKKLSSKELLDEIKFGDTLHVTIQVDCNHKIDSEVIESVMDSLDISNMDYEQP